MKNVYSLFFKIYKYGWTHHINFLMFRYFFQTLDADYSKNQDALLNVLCQLVSGKSFELILAAAAATGKLNNFALKLIR